MDNRKLFGSVTLVSLLAASLFGVAYAWEAMLDVPDISSVGVNDFDLSYVATGNKLGPNGNTVTVANGSIGLNTGDFTLQLDGGTVDIGTVTPGSPGNGTCANTDFVGSVIVTDGSSVAPGGSGGGIRVDIETLSGAPVGCQGDLVPYTVHVLLSNP
jgi:hypothetical protein